MTPLQLPQVFRNDKYGVPDQPLSPAPASSAQVDAPDAIVENWKTAEDGHGAIVRLVEMGGNSADVRLDFPLFNLQQTWRANAVEENPEILSVLAHSLEVKNHPDEILTLRVAATFAK
jgi:alpha-mannosidase